MRQPLPQSNLLKPTVIFKGLKIEMSYIVTYDPIVQETGGPKRLMSVHESMGLDWKGQNIQFLASYQYHMKSWQDGAQFSGVVGTNQVCFIESRRNSEGKFKFSLQPTS